MQEINFWETNVYQKNYKCNNNINEILDLIRKGELLSFAVCDKFVAGDEIKCPWEKNIGNDIIINYTDSDHSVIISNGIFLNFMSKMFFDRHKEEIINAFKEYYQNTNLSNYSVPGFVFSDEILDILLKKGDIFLRIKDVVLTKEQINRIKEKNIDAFLTNKDSTKQISSRYIFAGYTVDTIKNSKVLLISCTELDKVELRNLKYINNGTIISMLNSDVVATSLNEEDDLKKISQLALCLDDVGKKVTIKIPLTKRSLFSKYFEDLNLKNVDLIIRNDNYEYSYFEYLKEEAQLNNMVKDIKESNLSPLEKYFAVYNIVKNFKPYKENIEEKESSRYLRYILNNEYMVCVGYARLLETLLDKVGISANEFGVMIDVSYDDGFTLEDKSVQEVGHSRVIVSIDDDKYNIHGLYMSDPTWDNYLDNNYLNHALMPFDKMNTSRRMFKFSKYEPILDIHNFKEFNEQVNYLLRLEIERVQNSEYIIKKDKTIITAYQNVINRLVKGIISDPKYNYFMKKYQESKEEEDYIDYLTEFGNYLLIRTNKEITPEIIINAAVNADKALGKDVSLEKTREEYYEKDILSFPYEETKNEHELKSRLK